MKLDSKVLIPTLHQREGIDTIKGVVYDIDLPSDTVSAGFGSDTRHSVLMAKMTDYDSIESFAFGEVNAIIRSTVDRTGKLWLTGGAFIGNKEVLPTPDEVEVAKELLADFTLKLALQYMPEFFTGEGELVNVMPLVPTEKM